MSDIVQLKSEQTWEVVASKIIQTQIDAVLNSQPECSVMLTGGKTAAQLYLRWTTLLSLAKLKRIRFYFGDERCVPANHPESNFGMALRTLFSDKAKKREAFVARIKTDYTHPDDAARRYEASLPTAIDVLILGVGTDGHIASLFPHSQALHELERRVVVVDSPHAGAQRITITPVVINNSKKIFVLARGLEKQKLLVEARNRPHDFYSIPACLVLDAEWLTDAIVKRR